MIRGCDCEACRDRRFEHRTWDDHQVGLPTGSDHRLRVKNVDRTHNLIFYQAEGRVWGTVLSQPMILFKGMGDTGSPHYSDAGHFKVVKSEEGWGDVEWDPTIRL